jgi:hypothetical protein
MTANGHSEAKRAFAATAWRAVVEAPDTIRGDRYDIASVGSAQPMGRNLRATETRIRTVAQARLECLDEKANRVVRQI